MVPGPSGETSEKELVGALVHIQKAAVLWPTDDPAPGTQPVLRSYDCVMAEQVGEIPEEMKAEIEPYREGPRTFLIDEIHGFPYMQWGSGRKGVGKRMKEQRILFLLRKDDPAPIVVVVQPGSLKRVRSWITTTAQTARAPWHQWIVRLTLRSKQSSGGQPYSEIVPELAGLLDPDCAAQLKALWGDQLAAVAKRIVDNGTDADE
jgi:hypothetical protein